MTQQDLPILNKITKSNFIAEVRFHPVRRWRFDFADKQKKIAIEIEGGVWIQGRHNHPQGFIKDMEKYNEASKLGWRLLRYTPQQDIMDIANDIVELQNIKELEDEKLHND